MADQETQTVFVRLTRDFPAGVTHRRGGVALTAGPLPVQAEVTEDQLAALEADPTIQIVDEAEFQKWEQHVQAAPEHPSAEELANGDTTVKRSYEGEGGDDDETDEPETAEQLVEANKRDELVTLAQAEGVELDFENKQETTKAVIAEAIVAKRSENTGE